MNPYILFLIVTEIPNLFQNMIEILKFLKAAYTIL